MQTNDAFSIHPPPAARPPAAHCIAGCSAADPEHHQQQPPPQRTPAGAAPPPTTCANAMLDSASPRTAQPLAAAAVPDLSALLSSPPPRIPGSPSTSPTGSRRRRSLSRTPLSQLEDSPKGSAVEMLPPEPQEGNTEYKLKLVAPSAQRFQHLVTQMKWRLAEGEGEALYEIGVTDDGVLAGLSQAELDASLATLDRMAAAAGANTAVLRTREGASGRGRVAEVLVRRVPDDQQFLEVRVALLGSADAGKSTLLGVLTTGQMDSGRGRARLNLFRHYHEIKSGRTSSISCESLAFDGTGEVVNFDSRGAMATPAEICEKASKIVTFFDMAGHERYLKTTVFGLAGRSLDYAALVVPAPTGLNSTATEHLALAVALHLPVVVIITKVDICTRESLTRTLEQVTSLLKSPMCNKVPVIVTGKDDAILSSSGSDKITPIFMISSVTGYNLPLLRKFLNLLPTENDAAREARTHEPVDVQIEDTFFVQDVGPVVAGMVNAGSVRCGDILRLGPDSTGAFRPVTIISIHRNRAPYCIATAGQSASFALAGVERADIRTGQSLLGGEDGMACMEFEADGFVVHHDGLLRDGDQATAYVGSVRQPARVTLLGCPAGSSGLAKGESAAVRISLLNRPEHVRVGAKVLLRSPSLRLIGTVTTVTPYGEAGATTPVADEAPRIAAAAAEATTVADEAPRIAAAATPLADDALRIAPPAASTNST